MIITIQTNNDYGQKLYQKLKSDKNLHKVEINKKTRAKSVNEIELVTPGSPVSDDELLKVITQAAAGKSISVPAARKRTLSKIALWRKNR